MSFNSGWGKQWHATIKYISSNKTSFLCQSNFIEIIRLLQKNEVNLATHDFGDITRFETVMSFRLRRIQI